MKKYKVTVEKLTYQSGFVEIVAEDEKKAIEKVNILIMGGKLQTTNIKWDDPVYIDFSFQTTGDVE